MAVFNKSDRSGNLFSYAISRIPERVQVNPAFLLLCCVLKQPFSVHHHLTEWLAPSILIPRVITRVIIWAHREKSEETGCYFI